MLPADPPSEVIPAAPLIDPDIGQYVTILFWHQYPMPDNSKHGWFDTLVGRVVSAGKVICCEVSKTTPSNFGEDYPIHWDGSPLRFVNRDRIFVDEKTAKAYAAENKLQPPPNL
jgi:hypothetical protein